MAATLELRLSSLDAMRVPRGHCLSCDWCPRFLSPSKRILCDYCGCPPAKHHRVDNDNDDPNKKNKKMRLAAKVASSSGTPSSEDEDEEEEQEDEDDEDGDGTDSETDEEEEDSRPVIHHRRATAVKTRNGLGNDAKHVTRAGKKRLAAEQEKGNNDEDDRG